MREIWKDIEGYEGLYQVSSLGQIRNSEGLVKKNQLHRGRWRIQLCKEGKVRTYKVARLVATAFVSNPDNKPCVDHIDSNPQNDVYTNLRWVTVAENNNNPNTIAKYKTRRRIAQYDENGDLLGVFDSIKVAAKVYNYSQSSICEHLKGESSSSHLCQWRYLDYNDDTLIGSLFS